MFPISEQNRLLTSSGSISYFLLSLSTPFPVLSTWLSGFSINRHSWKNFFNDIIVTTSKAVFDISRDANEVVPLDKSFVGDSYDLKSERVVWALCLSYQSSMTGYCLAFWNLM